MNSIQKFEMMLCHMDNLLEEANKKGVPLEEVMKNSNGVYTKDQVLEGKAEHIS